MILSEKNSTEKYIMRRKSYVFSAIFAENNRYFGPHRGWRSQYGLPFLPSLKRYLFFLQQLVDFFGEFIVAISHAFVGESSNGETNDAGKE